MVRDARGSGKGHPAPFVLGLLSGGHIGGVAADPDTAAVTPARWESLLHGAVDMHVHTAGDMFPRLLDDIEAATLARDKGLAAMVLKGHVTGTADRATVVRQHVPGIEVFGSLVLNGPVGGLNPEAVQAAIRMGAKVIWGPTMWARNHATYIRTHPSRGYADLGMRFPDDGITVLDARGELLPVVRDILDQVARAGITFCTGHLSVEEAKVLVPEARRIGVERLVVSHPEYEPMSYSIADQVWLADAGAVIEHTMSCHLPFWFPTDRARYRTVWDVYDMIKAVGAERCVLSSDLGQVHSPPPTEGFREFMQMFVSLGASQKEIEVMTRTNPSRLLGL